MRFIKKPDKFTNKRKQNQNAILTFVVPISKPRFSWNSSGYIMHKNLVANSCAVCDIISARLI